MDCEAWIILKHLIAVLPTILQLPT